MSELYDNKVQSVILNNRQEIRINGIQSVDSFDEFRICATCNNGSTIYVDGEKLTIRTVNPDECFIEAFGNINGFFYDESSKKTDTGFFRRMFFNK